MPGIVGVPWNRPVLVKVTQDGKEIGVYVTGVFVATHWKLSVLVVERVVLRLWSIAGG